VTSPDVIIWVEGEPDVMALHEAGYPQVVTLKDGAPDKLRDEDDPARESDKRFAALSSHATMLAAGQKFILAGDMDAPGAVLREELARRLGRHRCWTVEWPEGCKDACDVLRTLGPEHVRRCIEEAQPYPIEGVQEVTGAKLDEYLERPAPPVLTTGVSSVDKILKLPGEGRLIIITGFPNSGKSTWMFNVMVHLMERCARRFLVFSPEMQPFEEFVVQCVQVLVGKPARRIRDNPFAEVMTRDERVRAGNWMRGRMSFLSTDSEDAPPTIDWILERARDCVLRLGVTDLLIDPVNELEQTRGNMSETEFIGRMLQRARSFAQRHGCNVYIIAHPQKMKPAKTGEALPPPGPYDISGSAHFANKSDIGITIHTPQKITQVHLWKSRFSRWGRKGNLAEMTYDETTCRYSSLDDEFSADLYRQASRGE
jgi:twinkle protein